MVLERVAKEGAEKAADGMRDASQTAADAMGQVGSSNERAAQTLADGAVQASDSISDSTNGMGELVRDLGRLGVQATGVNAAARVVGHAIDAVPAVIDRRQLGPIRNEHAQQAQLDTEHQQRAGQRDHTQHEREQANELNVSRHIAAQRITPLLGHRLGEAHGDHCNTVDNDPLQEKNAIPSRAPRSTLIVGIASNDGTFRYALAQLLVAMLQANPQGPQIDGRVETGADTEECTRKVSQHFTASHARDGVYRMSYIFIVFGNAINDIWAVHIDTGDFNVPYLLSKYVKFIGVRAAGSRGAVERRSQSYCRSAVRSKSTVTLRDGTKESILVMPRWRSTAFEDVYIYVTRRDFLGILQQWTPSTIASGAAVAAERGIFVAKGKGLLTLLFQAKGASGCFLGIGIWPATLIFSLPLSWKAACRILDWWRSNNLFLVEAHQMDPRPVYVSSNLRKELSEYDHSSGFTFSEYVQEG